MRKLLTHALGFTLVMIALTALLSGCASMHDYSGYSYCDMGCASGCYTDQCLAMCGCDY